MNRKPTAAAPLSVYAVKPVPHFPGVYSVKWSDLRNYPRTFSDLYSRTPSGQWVTGEAHPAGVYSAGLPREASPTIAAALDKAHGGKK